MAKGELHPARPNISPPKAEETIPTMPCPSATDTGHTDSPQTAALLFSEYICLAIMSFPYSYSVLGLVPGLILTVVQAGFVLYTSLIVWYV